jgi:putative ABC transport system permease protein
MNFIFKMAWRDSRASRRRLVLFSFSVVLGIAALVAIGSFSANLERAIDQQAKGLLGADLVVTSRAALSDEATAYLRELGAEVAREISFSSMMVFSPGQGATRLVNVRATAGAFPFYGDFVTDPADAVARFRAGGAVTLLEETLMRQFEVKTGDRVKLGETTFTVVGALQKLPGEASAVSATFAPRALIPLAALDGTGLTAKTALVRHRAQLRLPDTVVPETVEREMRRRFRPEQLSFDTVAERKRNLGRALENIEGFLSLVGFVALFLGAIGIASAIHVYVRQKITTVAVLRCLGASARQSFAVYLTQGLALGVFGAVVGAGLGLLIQVALPRLLQGVLPFEVDFFVAWAAVGRGALAGLVICLLFTVLPLLAVRKVSPLVALRSAIAETTGTTPDPWRIAIGVFIGVAVAAFAIWQTRSLRNGLGFAAMLGVGFATLGGLAQAIAWSARRWFPRRFPYVARQGVANLYRPQNRTVLLILSLGLGTFLMVTLFLARSTLLKEIQVSGGGARPNLLFFDIQDDQMEPLAKIVAAQGAPVLVRAPIVTMRIAAVKGQKVEQLLGPRGRGDGPRAKRQNSRVEGGEERPKGRRGGEGGIAGWTLRREYRSTFRGRLESTEKVVKGDFIGRAPAGTAVVPISMEQGLVEEMGLQLGDEVEWDVQGVPIRSRLTSVRAVEWRRLEPNFFVVFPEGVLEGAPKFHVAAVRAETPEHSARVQRAVVAALPSVTAIDLALVMQTVDAIFSKVAFVIQFMALFTVLTGVIVLVGAVMTGRFQRIRETVLLRTLGATRRQLTQIMLVEYTVLGVLAAIAGGSLALVANGLLAKFIFHLSPAAPPLELIGAVIAVVAVTLTTGLLANRGITRHPPLEVLRQET